MCFQAALLCFCFCFFFNSSTGASSHEGIQDLQPNNILLELLNPPNIPLTANQINNSTCGICGASYEGGIGDTLATVAAYCNISSGDAAGANPGLDPNNVTGQLVIIPCTNKDPAHCGTCGSSYIVQRQDTLSKIAPSCGMELGRLEMANQDIDFENIDGGQYIRIPCAGGEDFSRVLTGCGTCGFKYTVAKEGTLLSNVTASCDASVEELKQANPGFGFNASSVLREGQQLNIPCYGSSRSNKTCGLCGNQYKLGAEDGKPDVAVKCRVGLVDLTESNPNATFSAGEVLKIPCKQAPADQQSQCSSHLCNSTFVVTKNVSSVQEIATQCNVTAELISYANDIPPTAAVFSGQQLAIPCQSSPKPLNTCSICGSSLAPSIRVELLTVAKACNTTVDDIQRTNNITLETVGFGDILRMPCTNQVAGCGPCGIAYRAEAGDGLPSVAVKCATMMHDIKRANPELDFSRPVSGKLISIPCLSSEVSHGASTKSLSSTVILPLLLILL